MSLRQVNSGPFLSAVRMFKPPVNRTMRVLDRAFFKQENSISAARVATIQKVASSLRDLKKSKDILEQPKIHPVHPAPAPDGPGVDRKCILLRPEIKHDDRNTWSETVNRLVNAGDIDIMPYNLQLNYDNWDRSAILSSILPEDLLDEVPDNYNHAGHVAHMTLNERYLPYKHLIGEILLDKSPGIKTVINKVESLDDNEDNTFRTLNYEVLAGDGDLNVEAREGGSVFRFDYSKVFWNSKLGTEHARLVAKFQPGEAVCDVMAGVGPFAIPAGRKGVFVWANDLNPDCYTYLVDAISTNKVSQFVRPFSVDGHAFIPTATTALLTTTHAAKITHRPPSRTEARALAARNPAAAVTTTQIPQPRVFSHYVMNLPSTAMDFLPAFTGFYAGHEALFAPATSTPLPLVHCYCFVHGEGPRPPIAEDPAVRREVCARVSAKLGCEVAPGDEDVEIYNVRDVAPKKSQLCVSFRLPREVAFARAA